ncbi:manganese catalase family protein, partial [Micromonospora sp. NPDC050495]|uniref:manganese catalase family protein n=1 Tax=Micromonospora sp. NPDC050495 TaxID=3154936 RepID=UPI0033FF7FD5
MFTHMKDLQFEAKPDGPDAAFARRLQEVLGGKWGEMTVANQYLYQGWNCRLPGKYKDLLLDVGTEEMGHVEMIATMITRLLENAPLSLAEAAEDNPMVGAIYGGSNPAHFIHGGGALPVDSAGVPWNGNFITASGNLMADFQLNVTAEAQGRLQVARLFNMTRRSSPRSSATRTWTSPRVRTRPRAGGPRVPPPTARASSATTTARGRTPPSRSCRRATPACTAPTRAWPARSPPRSRASSPDHRAGPAADLHRRGRPPGRAVRGARRRRLHLHLRQGHGALHRQAHAGRGRGRRQGR